jgi:hypothetical protein
VLPLVKTPSPAPCSTRRRRRVDVGAPFVPTRSVQHRRECGQRRAAAPENARSLAQGRARAWRAQSRSHPLSARQPVLRPVRLQRIGSLSPNFPRCLYPRLANSCQLRKPRVPEVSRLERVKRNVQSATARTGKYEYRIEPGALKRGTVFTASADAGCPRLRYRQTCYCHSRIVRSRYQALLSGCEIIEWSWRCLIST